MLRMSWKDALLSAWYSTLAVSRMASVTEMGYVKPLMDLESDLYAVHGGARFTEQTLADQKDRLRELKLKAQLLADVPGCAGDL